MSKITDQINKSKARGVLPVLSIFMFSCFITACATEPAPWTKNNNSPWKAKHEAQAMSASSDSYTEEALEPVVDLEAQESISEEPMIAETVVVAETSPHAEVETEVVAVVVAAPEPEPIAVSTNGSIKTLPSSSYAVQVFAGNSMEGVVKYRDAHDLDSLQSVKTDRDGNVVYVLIDIHDDKSSALFAADQIQQKTGSKPWVRSLAGLQAIAIE